MLSCVWFFATLWAVAHQAPLSVGFSRQEYCMLSSRVAMTFSRGSFQPRDQTSVSCVSCIAGGFFTAEPLSSAQSLHTKHPVPNSLLQQWMAQCEPSNPKAGNCRLPVDSSPRTRTRAHDMLAEPGPRGCEPRWHAHPMIKLLNSAVQLEEVSECVHVLCRISLGSVILLPLQFPRHPGDALISLYGGELHLVSLVWTLEHTSKLHRRAVMKVKGSSDEPQRVQKEGEQQNHLGSPAAPQKGNVGDTG